MNTPPKNRILMLLENQPFPQDIRVHREAYALVQGGYRVTVICPRSAEQPFQENVNGVRVYRYPAPPAANSVLGYLWEYAYSITASFLLSLLAFFSPGFDVIHANNPPDTFVFIGAFYKLFGKRFVYDHHDLSPEMYRARFQNGGNRLVFTALVWLEKLTYSFADHVIVTNQSYKRVAMVRGRVPDSRITIVRNGIELSHLNSVIEPDPASRRMGKSILGYVGVMGNQDGVEYLLRALHHLLHDLGRSDFYCLLIGGGDACNDLKALASDLGLGDHVRFTGFVYGEHLLRYLLAADICLDASPANTYTNCSTLFKMMEYMSLGRPIVTFDLPEHRFTAQQAAVYVAPNDIMEFAKALARLMDDPCKRVSLGAFGIRRIKTQLAWDYSVPNLLRVYETVLRPAEAEQRSRANTQSAPEQKSSAMVETADCKSSG